jgi:hypothetical protein
MDTRQLAQALHITRTDQNVSDINRVTEVEGMYTTTFMATLVITNDSAKASIVIAKYEIRPPWHDPEIEALDDPHEAHPRSDNYVVHAALEWPREWVINHHRYQYGKLAPGDTIRGMLLARGINGIPGDLKTKNPIEMEVVITDTKKREYKAKIGLWPELMPKLIKTGTHDFYPGTRQEDRTFQKH